MEKRSNREMIEGMLRLADAVVVDVGCGDGSLARLLARKGAHVIGVEVSPKLLDRARAADAIADEDYILGKAEDLPLDSSMADIVIFFNSFHHIHADGMVPALDEAARVLKPGGTLYVAEPLAQGPYFEAMKPVHDETVVRGHAYDVLRTAHAHGFEWVSEIFHRSPMPLKSFATFRDRIVAVNPEANALFEALGEQMLERFERLGKRTEDGWVFEQPMRVNILRKRAE